MKTKRRFDLNKIKMWQMAVSLIMILIASCFIKKDASAAEVSISVKEINYTNSTITLQANSGDSVVYFSDATMKKWDPVPGLIGSDGTITMDISWISASKDYILPLKGDYSLGVISVTIPKQVTKFTASFNKLKGMVIFSNAENRPIQWRKKGSSSWNSLNTDTMVTDLNYYYANGAQICYRLIPVNGTGIMNAGLRPSNEVTISIPKKIAAPNVTVNGSKFSITTKKGMSYRKVYSDGTMSAWSDINTTTLLLLKDIAAEAMYSVNTTQKEVTLQVRTNASNTAQVSNITTLKVPVQKAAPNVATCGISLKYTSSSAVALTVRAASSNTPFEYTIVLKGKELNYQTTNWKPVTSSSAVSISSTAAPIGSHIYVRMKSIEATDTVNFALASVETDIAGINGVEYPSATQVTQLTTLVSTAGVCQVDTTSSYLTFSLNSTTATTVSQINFYDAYGINKGTVTSKSTVATNSNSTGASDKYVITTSITSTGGVDTIMKEPLYAYLTLANGEMIKSTSTSGIILYLYPATVVKNPVDTSYSVDFDRIYLSNDSQDTSSFKFKLDFGTDKVIDPSGINKFTSTASAISTIKYNGYTLVNGTDYNVEYGSYVEDDKSTIVTATVTVNVAQMEKSASITTTDHVLPLIINLNNNEVLNNDIYITMISTASLDNIPIAWSITEGSLKEKSTSIVTNTDGTTTTTTQDVITYTIALSMFSDTYDVSVSNVTWGDASIFGSSTISKGKATIYLSNAKINKLTTISTDTKNIIITLSNGYVIKSGCKLTILNAD